MKENCGIKIGLSYFQDTPVHNGPIPDQFFLEDYSGNCINYEVEEEVSFQNIDVPVGLTQISNVDETETTSSCAFNQDTANDHPNDNNYVSQKKVNPYNFLITSFRELCSYLEGNSTMDDLIKIRTYFLEQTCSLKESHVLESNRKNNHPTGTFVSSNASSSKRKRTHKNRSF